MVILIFDDDGKNHECDDAEIENGNVGHLRTTEGEMGEERSRVAVVDSVDHSDGAAADGGDDDEVGDGSVVDRGEFEEGPDSEGAAVVVGDVDAEDGRTAAADNHHRTELREAAGGFRTEEEEHQVQVVVRPYVVGEVDPDEELVPAVDSSVVVET